MKFPYSYYALKIEPECYKSGKLLGKEGKDGWKDMELTECQPTEGNKLKCIVVLDADFYAAKGEYLKCKQDLISCQKGKPPSNQ